MVENNEAEHCREDCKPPGKTNSCNHQQRNKENNKAAHNVGDQNHAEIGPPNLSHYLFECHSPSFLISHEFYFSVFSHASHYSLNTLRNPSRALRTVPKLSIIRRTQISISKISSAMKRKGQR